MTPAVTFLVNAARRVLFEDRNVAESKELLYAAIAAVEVERSDGTQGQPVDRMTYGQACASLATYRARAEAAELVVATARRINSGVFQDVRMTGVLAVYDQTLMVPCVDLTRETMDRLKSHLAIERTAIDELEAKLAKAESLHMHDNNVINELQGRLVNIERERDQVVRESNDNRMRYENSERAHGQAAMERDRFKLQITDAHDTLRQFGAPVSATICWGIGWLAQRVNGMMAERDAARKKTESMTDSDRDDFRAIVKLSGFLGNPCVQSDISISDGVVQLAIDRLKECKEHIKINHYPELHKVRRIRDDLQGHLNEIRQAIGTTGIPVRAIRASNGEPVYKTTLEMVQELIADRAEKTRIIQHDVTELHATLREILVKAGITYDGGIKNHVALLASEKRRLEEELVMAHQAINLHGDIDRAGLAPRNPLLNVPQPPVVDWSKMPAWANWVALNPNNTFEKWSWFREPPKLMSGCWCRHNNDEIDTTASGSIPATEAPTFSGDWKDSLVQRPAT